MIIFLLLVRNASVSSTNCVNSSKTITAVTEKEHKHIFEIWLKQYKGVIFKVVRAYAFNIMDQEDLFQEIVIQVWHSVPAFRQESAVTTWIYRIALNIAIKWVRKERKHNQTQTLDQTNISESVLLESNPKTDDRLDWLYEQISRLDAIDRSLALLLLDDFSYKEMAGIVGITESNVGVRINRIKKQLITKVKNDYGL
ncbi:sigma-70 family RNA polymerase sigma factor [Cytophagaceae bacterium BD1B2-1]|uniref:Sigma-70 family RNA polymerase sigma factor n=1 Tax=Xanthocytophaga agilis TaxID=3048010 RepID=A0AAE3UC25_9BACT|nr:sigma-70 family RNA polymerase sigma factor [Xanthocytophaga agilis]